MAWHGLLLLCPPSVFQHRGRIVFVYTADFHHIGFCHELKLHLS